MALKRRCRSTNRQLSHSLERWERSPWYGVLSLGVCGFGRAVSREGAVSIEELFDLLRDERGVGSEVFSRESEFHETLLFHEHRVGAVVDDAFSEDRSSETLLVKNTNSQHREVLGSLKRAEWRAITDSVNLFSRDMRNLAAQDKVVALCTQCRGDFSTSQHKREAISILQYAQ